MNLWNEASDSKFVTKEWNIVNDQSNANFNVGNEIICNTEVLNSIVGNTMIPCILVGVDNTVVTVPATQVAFKKCTLFTNCITKIGRTTLKDAEDLELVMLMHVLLEYSSN